MSSFGSCMPRDPRAAITLRLKRIIAVSSSEAGGINREGAQPEEKAGRPRVATSMVEVTLTPVGGSLGIAVADDNEITVRKSNRNVVNAMMIHA